MLALLGGFPLFEATGKVATIIEGPRKRGNEDGSLRAGHSCQDFAYF
jgi:hypothetical protein